MRALVLIGCLSACSPTAASHVESCTDASKCGNGFDPPTGGPHCSSTLPCRIYAGAQNRCEWVHNLEHGHLVLAYNCPAGCDSEIAALGDYWRNLPPSRRALVTPDPLLGKKFAATVWGHAWSSDTLDTAKIDELAKLQDKEAPEPGLGCAQ